MRIMAVLCTLSLLIGGAALMSKRAEAAGWISGADSYAAPWVKEIEQELLKKEYRYVFGNDPRTPQASVLRLLNQAAKALEAKDSALAGKFVREAIGVLEEGVRKHYFSEADIEPITKFIREHTPVKIG
jgi:hypothetical protein